MKAMLGIILAFSFSASAATDLGSLSKLNGKTGEGLNAYESGTFACSIEVIKEENSLTINQTGAYYSELSIYGNDVVKAEKTSSGLVLETAKSDPFKSGLCGDWISARNVSTEAIITSNKVEISLRYKCGLKSHKDTYTCSIK